MDGSGRKTKRPAQHLALRGSSPLGDRGQHQSPTVARRLPPPSSQRPRRRSPGRSQGPAVPRRRPAWKRGDCRAGHGGARRHGPGSGGASPPLGSRRRGKRFGLVRRRRLPARRSNLVDGRWKRPAELRRTAGQRPGQRRWPRTSTARQGLRGRDGAVVISRGSAECSQRWCCFRPAGAAAGEVGRRCAPGRAERRRAVATVRATNAAFSENDAVAAAAAAAEAGCYRRGRSRKLSMSPAMRTRYDLRAKYIIQ